MNKWQLEKWPAGAKNSNQFGYFKALLCIFTKPSEEAPRGNVNKLISLVFFVRAAAADLISSRLGCPIGNGNFLVSKVQI